MPTNRRQFLIGAATASAAAALPTGRLLAAEDKQAGSNEVPWLAEVQQPPKTAVPLTRPLASLLVDDAGKRIADVDRWKKRREVLRREWLEYLHPLPQPAGSPPALKVIVEDRRDGVLRQRVSYEIEPELLTEAYLLRPLSVSQKRPGVVVMHSTVDQSIRQPAGIEGKPEKALGLTLAKAGYIAFCPRNFLWPENRKLAAKQETARFHKRHPQCKGMAKMLFDAERAVDILAAMPDVDAQRLGAVGHSLGGKEALYLAAFDTRIKAAVSSEGGVGIDFSNWDAPWYLSPDVHKKSFTHEHHELLALAAPRALLILGGDSADGDRSWPLIDAASDVYRLYSQPPRLGLLNHHQGHSVPPIAVQRTVEWLDAYL